MSYRFPASALFSLLPLCAADPALTIYNQNFAVVRETVRLDLKPGVSRVRHTGLTARVEPDSVILRDPAGQVSLQILEQNYLADPVSLENLLLLHEGKTIEFQMTDGKIVSGTIIRAGHGPAPLAPPATAQWYSTSNFVPNSPTNSSSQPLIESQGRLRFGLPGIPLFPGLASDAILNPTLDWLIRTDRAARLDAELGYLSGGMNWKADYNVVASEAGDTVQLIGWVTIANQSGKSFTNARIALMAGEVNKTQPGSANRIYEQMGVSSVGGAVGGPPVVEKTFDDYHLYTLQNPTTLPDRETKQVEFLRASQVSTKRIYVYDGTLMDTRYQNWNYDTIRNNPEYGTQSNPKVWVMREFVNSQANHLGRPLPQGNLRFYRSDTNGQLEFTGENQIRHTPKGETIQVYTGAAFDVVGERRRTDYQINHNSRTVDEAFEIKLRNHKSNPVEIRVVEHLYRGYNWNITIETDPHVKKDSQTVEYLVTVKPDEERILKYSAHYTW